MNDDLKLDHKGYPIKEDDVDDLVSPIDYPKRRTSPDIGKREINRYAKEAGISKEEAAKHVALVHAPEVVEGQIISGGPGKIHPQARSLMKHKRAKTEIARLREKTNDLEDVENFFVALSKGMIPGQSLEQQIEAAKYIWERTNGKPVATNVLIQGSPADNPHSDVLESLTDEELEQLLKKK